MKLTKYKLDKPRTTIRFGDDTNDTLFEFGSANPINRLRYVKVGDRIHLIDDNFYPLVSSQIGTLISQTLLPGSDTITALRLTDISLVRSDEGKWQVTPENSELSTDAINAVVDEWQHAQAFGVHDYLQREQLGKVSVTTRSNGIGQTVDFVITDIDPWLIIARPELGIEYHFDAEFYDRLLRPGNDIDKAVLDAEEATFKQP
jgi:hypothetical protein